MNLPREVKIGPAVYKIRHRDLDEKHGNTEHMSARIGIHSKQSPVQARDTVLHETLHAIGYISSLQNILDLTDEEEERLVRFLTPWLLGLIRDNPTLIGYLTS